MVTDAANRGGWTRLVVASTILAVVWLMVLPRLIETTGARQRLRDFERAGIEPAAFFYSDHPRNLRGRRPAGDSGGPGGDGNRNLREP